MKTFTVCELLSGETWQVESYTCQDAVYIVVIDKLGKDYNEFRESHGKYTFSLVSKEDDRITYISLYRSGSEL